jgi:hypothetical protein
MPDSCLRRLPQKGPPVESHRRRHPRLARKPRSIATMADGTIRRLRLRGNCPPSPREPEDGRLLVIVIQFRSRRAAATRIAPSAWTPLEGTESFDAERIGRDEPSGIFSPWLRDQLWRAIDRKRRRR